MINDLTKGVGSSALAQQHAGIANSVPPASPLTAQLAVNLSALGNVLAEVEAELVSVGDRLFGSIPRGVSGEAQRERAEGQAADLLNAIEALNQRARSILGEAQRINSRV